MDQKTRKLMTIHKVLDPRDDVDWLYVSIKEGGRDLVSTEDSIENNIDKHEERLINSHQTQYWQRENQQKDNNQKTKMGRKTTQWTF